MAISNYPKTTDVIPYGEEQGKKSLTIRNEINLHVHIGQMNSTWERVRFIITDNKSKTEESTKWLATLEPGDTIELFFNPAKAIDK